LKQGLFVAIGAGLAFVGVRLGSSHRIQLEQSALTLLLLLGLSVAGGWFGGQLFPPVVRVSRRTTLTRLEG
jgi:hypothetical protein